MNKIYWEKHTDNITYYKSELLTELHPNKLILLGVHPLKKDPQTCSDSNLPDKFIQVEADEVTYEAAMRACAAAEQWESTMVPQRDWWWLLMVVDGSEIRQNQLWLLVYPTIYRGFWMLIHPRWLGPDFRTMNRKSSAVRWIEDVVFCYNYL